MTRTKPKSSTLFTSSFEMAEILARKIDVTEVVCEERALSPRLFSFCQWRAIPLQIANRRDDMDQSMVRGEVGLSYGCGIIFRQENIDWFPHGIWNIHTGKLPDYRGRHPMSWAFLNGDPSIVVTVHQIDEAIDRGTTLAVAELPRGMNDSLSEIEQKLFRAMDEWLFDTVVSNYLKDVPSVVNDVGAYQPALYRGVEIDDPASVTAAYLFNAVRAQRSYGGVRLARQSFVDAYYYDDRFQDKLAHGLTVTCKDGIRLVLFTAVQWA